MDSVEMGVGKGEEQTNNRAAMLLRRCRHALAIGAPEWEMDVETAMELDAALVCDIDTFLSAPS